MTKRYISYRWGEWYEFFPNSSGAMLNEAVGPQGELGERTEPQPGDVFLQAYDARGRVPLPPLPEGLKWEGPHGLDDDIWVIQVAE